MSARTLVTDVGDVGKYYYFPGVAGFHELDEIDLEAHPRGPYGQPYGPGGFPDTLSIIDMD